MNLWTRVGVDEPGSRVEGGEPVLCEYGSRNLHFSWFWDLKLQCEIRSLEVTLDQLNPKV
jgi:hypothetical protein